MTKMYDPNDFASHGPQVTARPGTKRHLAQVRARAVFFAIIHSNARAKAQRIQDQIDTLTADFLANNPTAGNA